MAPTSERRRRQRVLIVDDDPLVRSALRLALPDDTISVVGEAQHGADALRVLASGVAVDVVLMDIWTPTISGLAAAGPLGSRFPHLRIVLMTSFLSNELIPHIASVGVNGFVLKTAGIPEIAAAILGTAPDAHPRPCPAALSPRERQLVDLIAAGSSTSHIAERLGLTVNTVKTYTSRLFTKLGVRNRIQLAHAARALSARVDPPRG